jgi:penicillin-binding protein 1A
VGQQGLAKVALEQDSGPQVALLALDNASGDIKAMIGGRSFQESKFNRATQALRQVGSAFKPFVYTAAIDTGEISIDDKILDAPTTFMTASGPYTPSNYDGKFWGNIPFRKAVANSRNIPALKVADAVGIKTVIDYARRFGVTSPLPPFLPIALGAAEVTLMEETAAFTAFPNDGIRVTPRYIRKVTDYDGHVREENFPEVTDVVGARTARTMVSLLQGVVTQGTATEALKLKHAVAGKTGTTNDFTDAWFVGFSPSVTCGVWIGFDEKKTLGNKETGGQAALPIWIDFMKVALQGRDAEAFSPIDTEIPVKVASTTQGNVPAAHLAVSSEKIKPAYNQSR